MMWNGRQGLIAALFAAVLTAMVPGAAPAAAVELAQVAGVEGKVDLYRQDDRRRLRPDDRLSGDDRIVTGVDGRVRLALPDGASITIGPASEVRLAEVVRSETRGRGRLVLDLVIGIVRAVVDPARPPGQIELRARSAVAAARSTDWVVIQEVARSSVFVVSGTVAVSLPGTSSSVLLEAGEGIDIAAGADQLPEVKRWGAGRVAETMERVRPPR